MTTRSPSTKSTISYVSANHRPRNAATNAQPGTDPQRRRPFDRSDVDLPIGRVGRVGRVARHLGDEDPAESFDHYHAPGFVLHNDGVPLDHDRLLAHVSSGRKRAAEVRTAVQDIPTSGDWVAARHVLTAVMHKGQVIATEILMFGRLAPDGRLQEARQLTRG